MVPLLFVNSVNYAQIDAQIGGSMARSKAPFSLVSKKSTNGIAYWYVRFRDPFSGVSSSRSTGVVDDGRDRSRQSALAVSMSVLFAAAEPKPVEPKPVDEVLFRDFAADFWSWEKSEYLKARLARDPKAISQEHAYNCQLAVNRHAMPFLGGLALDKITPAVLDHMVTELLTKKAPFSTAKRRPRAVQRRGLSSQTVKHVIHALGPIFDQAKSQGFIGISPIPGIMGFAVRARVRDAFTTEEASALLNPLTVPTIWAQPGRYRWKTFNPWVHYSLSLLCAMTGARVGSVITLKREDLVLCKLRGVEYYEVHLNTSLGRLSGVKAGSKTGQGTVVPVAAQVMNGILPHLAKEGFLFASESESGVLATRSALLGLKAAMRRIGLTDEDQEKRLLGFHSWRHTFVTRARAAGVNQVLLSAFTEHKDERTTARYSHLKPHDLLDAIPLQLGMLG